MRIIVIMMVLAGSGYMLAGCDQSGSGHMSGGGMMGRPPRSTGDQAVPEPQSEAAHLFRQYCGQCHAPPAPSTHTASEWPGVVAKMKQYMVTQGRAVPKGEEMQEILDYLQRHSD